MEVTGQEARFRAMFAEEAEGRLATLSELLLELERNGEDQDLLSSVFREAHTLEGAAAVVGLADVLRVAHAMEEVLEGNRRQRVPVPANRQQDRPGHGRLSVVRPRRCARGLRPARRAPRPRPRSAGRWPTPARSSWRSAPW